MTFVQRPTVIGLHESPRLLRAIDLQRIRLNVTHDPLHFVLMIEKDFPTGAAPDGMIG